MSNSGFSTSRLGRMHDVMAAYVEHGAVTGVVTALSRHSEVHIDAIGAIALDGAPMQRDSIFRIASLTKAVTAVAAMILVEECRLRLDDSTDKFLPELAGRRVMKDVAGPVEDTVPAERALTARDLLTMRMGLGYPMGTPFEAPIWAAFQEAQVLQGPPHPQSVPPLDEWLQRVARLPLLYQPGTKWMYDLSTDVLGALVERVSGQALEQFFQERIFMPLGMKDTAFSVPEEKIHRLVDSYEPDPETGALKLYDRAVRGDWSQPPKFALGASGLVSTVEDFLIFGQMLLNYGRYGNERILSRSTVQAMITPQLPAEQIAGSELFLGENQNWGLGVAVCTQRDGTASSPGRFGWTGGLGTAWYSDPAEELVGVLLTQTSWTSPEGPEIFHDFWTLAYGAVE